MVGIFSSCLDVLTAFFESLLGIFGTAQSVYPFRRRNSGLQACNELLPALYGLKQSPLEWVYDPRSQFATSIGFDLEFYWVTPNFYCTL